MGLICLAVSNWKVLPLVWHIRIFSKMIMHGSFANAHKTQHSIFSTFTTSSRSPMWECDFMGHKSNASYYSDLDIARSDMILRLLSSGMARLSKGHAPRAPGAPELKGKVFPVLCASTTNYQREIAPYQLYQMETSILSWDRKWMYIRTEFIAEKKGKLEVCATALMKVVFKAGRITVSPEVLFEASGLLPIDEEVRATAEVKRVQGLERIQQCGIANELT
ncbi:hypothetical protein AUEXF2481DRAFT_579268 [Aureobasidium subglaciale EXF-2481]|uniref:Thioesterase domain-containing protein n=1 Tax=Aureobasidium subglaciale (strain EXF-2481) TaxID=1043005 RepID=A0A074YTR0_AURSE|nr:uncharacterized protein AUEXF2481DRAFT_579268 [Aureobasidium subglaciale EXF-2481]KEQ90226.1 hypothetical protein AUEXF2481DRAFT_579268 [Aureobasidium subglaciale EXF-2481]